MSGFLRMRQSFILNKQSGSVSVAIVSLMLVAVSTKGGVAGATGE